MQALRDLRVLGTLGLLQFVKGLFQLPYNRHIQSEWLHHVYRFLKFSLQECVLHIHLVQMPTLCHDNCKQDTDDHHLRNRHKHLIIVNVVLLCIALDH